MAKASKRRGKKKAAKRKPKARKPAKRAPAKRKSPKRKSPKRAPSPQGEPWPMIFAVLLALAVALIAGWHFNGSAEAAEVIGKLSSIAVGEFRVTDTWLTVAHPHFIPVFN
jgi:hypothetical protein